MVDTRNYRIESIDLLRGVVMIIMALDHVRVYFHFGTFFSNPTDLATTTSLLFFTRWITHFCAPVFVFLAGTSAFLFGTRRNSTREVARFLFTRGVWLVILEVTVVTFAWSFDVTHNVTVLQVIWAIGVGMIALSGLVFLPLWAIVTIGAVLVAGHNVLDGITYEGGSVTAMLWYALHERSVVPIGSGAVFFVYPVIPWIGLMALGYGLGALYRGGFDEGKRKRLLLALGAGATGLFVILRFFNIYGDSHPWEAQDTAVKSFLSFLNTSKYPPSLLFLLMTIGPSLLFLRAVEGVRSRMAQAFVVVGRVPLFFYVVHIYLIHVLAFMGLLYAGLSLSDMVLTFDSFATARLADYGYNLAVVYATWIAVVVALYPLCRYYNDFKASNRSKWWTSYL